jgi:hypothetical protein
MSNYVITRTAIELDRPKVKEESVMIGKLFKDFDPNKNHFKNAKDFAVKLKTMFGSAIYFTDNKKRLDHSLVSVIKRSDEIL